MGDRFTTVFHRYLAIDFMRNLTEENNFYYQCGALVLILFSSAIVSQFPGTWGEDVFSLLILLMLIVSIKSLHINLTWRRVVWSLVFILGLLNAVEYWLDHTWIDYLNMAALFSFFGAAVRTTSHAVLFKGRVDFNRIVGSLSLYLLIGLMWTLIYLFVLSLDPDAISGIEIENWRQGFAQAAYFSFVTLTTLGYGDVLPKTPLTRFLAYAEAVTGVFYMAVVVASLVSIGINHATQKRFDQSS